MQRPETGDCWPNVDLTIIATACPVSQLKPSKTSCENPYWDGDLPDTSLNLYCTLFYELRYYMYV